jgi:hypothetical protein
MHKHVINFALALFCSLSALVTPASASTYVTFDVPSAEGAAIPEGVNKWGSVTGYYTTISQGDYGFLYQMSTGVVTTFSAVSNKVTSTYPMSINDSGWIVGYYYDSTGMHGFLRNPKYTILNAPGAGTGNGQGTRALSINSSGEIAGVYWDSSSVEHGFVWDASGNYTTFSIPGGANVTSAVINDSGEVAGSYQATGPIDIPSGFTMDTSGNITTFLVPGSEETFVTGINSSGQLTGYYNMSGDQTEPFFRDQYGNFTTFSVPNYIWTAGIEDSGNVIGTDNPTSATRKGWQMTTAGDLTYFVDPNAGSQGTVAWCVSGNGKVAGYYFDSSGNAHDFVKSN